MSNIVIRGNQAYLHGWNYVVKIQTGKVSATYTYISCDYTLKYSYQISTNFEPDPN
ncbi:hypothetical protein SAMN05421813_1223 [Daejeonella rubra]|uniref:Uncharacterized protein n=1 Tax=Daejeonella rubra TaxID=990371 RepID=A0A1G9VPX5_9SPHI|nr:hypothetical protein [Daejeonella rubra]SDM74284.1 hypothetical protein SAMN05421813_1223 [Daejeonella rubra]